MKAWTASFVVHVCARKLPRGIDAHSSLIDSLGAFSSRIYQHVLETSIRGKTGLIKFDDQGNRVEPEYEIVAMDTRKWVPIAFWENGVFKSRDNTFRWSLGGGFPPVGQRRENVLRVVTVAIKPYVFFSQKIEPGTSGGAVSYY